MITLTVRLHSILRNRDGQIVNELKIEMPSGATVHDILLELNIPMDLDVLYSLNGRMVEARTKLHEDDYLALIPAVSGGSRGEL